MKNHFGRHLHTKYIDIKNNYLATMTPSEHDEYSSRFYGRAQLPPVLAEGLDAMATQLPGHIVCWVIPWLGKKQRESRKCTVNLKSQ